MAFLLIQRRKQMFDKNTVPYIILGLKLLKSQQIKELQNMACNLRLVDLKANLEELTWKIKEIEEVDKLIDLSEATK